MTPILRAVADLLTDEQTSPEARIRAALVVLRPYLEASPASTGPKTAAERMRDWRAKQRDGVTKRVTDGVTEGVGDGLDLDRGEETNPAVKAGEKKGEIPAELVDLVLTGVTETVTKRVTGVTRKTPKTHCPGPEEAPEKVDAWCRSHKLPPASEVEGVRGMLLWHQKNGVPRASWLATWRSWQNPARDAPSAPPWRRQENTGSPVQRTPDFELYPHELKRIADAQKGSR